MKKLTLDTNAEIHLNQLIKLVKLEGPISINYIIMFYDNIGYTVSDRTIRIMRSNINRKEGTEVFIAYQPGAGYVYIDKNDKPQAKAYMWAHMHFFAEQAKDMFQEFEAARKFAFNNLDYEVKTFEELIKEI